jgi:hypothetical protein
MIKKIIFSGCSITAGNELWEEAHIPNYASMTFKEGRKVMEAIEDHKKAELYNREHAFPALVGKEIGLETINLGISGISNKEIALRTVACFDKEHYDDTMVVMQFTTHNRLFLKYKEENKNQIFGSFVVMPEGNDHRLSHRQNNILKEMFFEFMPESLMVMDDHIFFYYAVEALKNRGIPVYILWADVEILDWANWDINKGYGAGNEFRLLNDIEPQWISGLSKHFTDKHHSYNLLGSTLQKVAGENSKLPRLHFKKDAHERIAKLISEKLKCIIG